MMSDTLTESRLLTHAIELHKGGFHGEAKKRYAQVLKSNPNNLDALNLWGLLAFQTNETEEALGLLRSAIILDPKFSDAHYHLGLIYQANGNPTQAVKHFEHALASSPQDTDIQLKLSESLRVIGQFSEAVRIIENTVRDNAKDPKIFIELGKAYRDAGALDHAVESYNKAIATGELVDQAELELGNLLRLLGRFDEASAAFDRAIIAAPDNTVARLQLGRTLIDWGKPNEALAVFQSAIKINPKSKLLSMFYADTLLVCGKFELAKIFLDKATSATPSDLGIKALQGHALDRAGRTGEGRQIWRDVLAVDVGQIDALRHLATTAQGNNKFVEEVIRYYEAALKHSPRNPELLNEYIHHLLIFGKPQAALDKCEKCLQIAPGNTPAIASKIIGLFNLGRRNDIRNLADDERFILPMRFTDAPEFETIDAFNKALTRHVLSHPTLKFKPPKKSTRFGDHTGDLRFGMPRAPVDALEVMIGNAITAYRAAMANDPGHPFLANFPDQWGLTIWAIVMGSLGHQTPHIHPAGWLSGVYYPQVSKVVAKQGGDNAGWIEFGRPPDDYALTVEPDVTLYRPEEGLMLLFPSYIYHRTIPYVTDETRVSVAFDVFPIRAAKQTEPYNLAKIVAPNSII
ncbi:tetratricopeptide repeat protein [Alphaproteobacteria bacterium]|nr:tetratricopeptide repeat protein [Alphaproteobacteria bacterium]